MRAEDMLGKTGEDILEVFPDLQVENDPEDIQEPDCRAYLIDPSGVFEIVFNSAGAADTVFIYRDCDLIDSLPMSMGSDRNVVRRYLGMPNAEGCQYIDPYLGEQGDWDRYNMGDYVLHFKYQYDSDQICLVTYMSHEVIRRIETA